MEPHDDNIKFAGDYNMSSIILHNHANSGFTSDEDGVNIQRLVVEMNIYEGINSNAITGSLVIVDSINLIGNLPIQGTERLSFKLSTPGAHEESHIVDCSEETGNPMHIYKLTDKKQVNEGTTTYVLHFCSREFLRNLRTKVSEAFTGTIDQMVNKILNDENGLDSRRKLFYQRTRNQDKIVIPNMRPFKAIELLAKRALSDQTESQSAGYHFYQTTKGFHFRSFESMCVNSNGMPRQVKQEFNYMPINLNDPQITDVGRKRGQITDGDKILHDLTSVEEYSFVNNFHDVAMNQAAGTYAHRVITHNLYNKSYRIDDYHYHNRFNQTKHTDEGRGFNASVVDTPVDFDDKNVSDYAESRVTVMPTTQYSHDEATGAFGIDVEQDGITEGARVSQANSFVAGTKLKMTIKGQSYLQVGDVIRFNMLSVENKEQSRGKLDPHFSGRYIIESMRHRVTNNEYIQVIECAKDSVVNSYSKYKRDTFPGSRLPYEKGSSVNLAYLDDIGTMDGY
jgi:hypothetical protein